MLDREPAVTSSSPETILGMSVKAGVVRPGSTRWWVVRDWCGWKYMWMTYLGTHAGFEAVRATDVCQERPRHAH